MAIRGSQTVQQGWNQSTAAMQAIMASGVGYTRSSPKTPPRPRRAGAPRVRPPEREPRGRPRRRKASSSRPARLVKGSAAAKRHMAKLRAMVGRRKRR